MAFEFLCPPSIIKAWETILWVERRLDRAHDLEIAPRPEPQGRVAAQSDRWPRQRGYGAAGRQRDVARVPAAAHPRARASVRADNFRECDHLFGHDGHLNQGAARMRPATADDCLPEIIRVTRRERCPGPARENLG